MSTKKSPNTNVLAKEGRDVDVLRGTVVDAASVCISLWISYLLVLLYLFVAVGEITHRDLFLENPVKLPFLNVDLPLVGFFIFGPGLILVIHTYTLIHFALLADKISVFRKELLIQTDESIRLRLRRLLPSNIFLQLLAGPRESASSMLGSVLRLIAWFTLVASPVALLVFFQLQFLPFHHEAITWWQRIAVVLDLTLLWTMWPSIARGRATKTQWKDLSLRRTAAIELLRDPTALWAALSRIAMRPRWRSRRLRPSMVAALATLIVLCLVFLIATFPGERLDSLPSVRFIPWKHGRDNPWGLDYWEFRSPHKLLVDGDVDFGFRRADSLWSNRLMLPDVDVVDHTKYDSEDKLAGIETTVSLRVRHLEGAILS
jgi:hypothetical protein